MNEHIGKYCFFKHLAGPKNHDTYEDTYECTKM